MRLRRLTLPAAAFFAVSSTAIAATGLPTQRQHAKRVEAQIAAVSVRLEPIVNAWEGARLRLATVDTRLHENVARLRLARANLRGAQIRIEHRLAELYVSPNPTVVDVLAGATSISDLIDRLKVSQVLSSQDAVIGRQAVVYQRAVTRREALLERQRHARAATVARLAASRQTIERNLATQRNLLASIHQNIRTLQAQQAARERRFAVQARVRIARRVALARERAAADALAPTPTAALPAAPQPLPAAPAIAAAPAAPVPLPAAPAPTPTAPAVLPVAPPTHTIAASIAARYLGVPYAWGGASPAGFDCSGLVTYVYAQLGVSLPHYTVAQWNATLPIAASALQPGDLVFFDGLAHVGIYIGGGQFIHAPHTGTVVQIATLSGYWGQHLDGARRVP